MLTGYLQGLKDTATSLLLTIIENLPEQMDYYADRFGAISQRVNFLSQQLDILSDDTEVDDNKQTTSVKGDEEKPKVGSDTDAGGGDVGDTHVSTVPADTNDQGSVELAKDVGENLANEEEKPDNAAIEQAGKVVLICSLSKDFKAILEDMMELLNECRAINSQVKAELTKPAPRSDDINAPSTSKGPASSTTPYYEYMYQKFLKRRIISSDEEDDEENNEVTYKGTKRKRMAENVSSSSL